MTINLQEIETGKEKEVQVDQETAVEVDPGADLEIGNIIHLTLKLQKVIEDQVKYF